MKLDSSSSENEGMEREREKRWDERFLQETSKTQWKSKGQREIGRKAERGEERKGRKGRKERERKEGKREKHTSVRKIYLVEGGGEETGEASWSKS